MTERETLPVDWFVKHRDTIQQLQLIFSFLVGGAKKRLWSLASRSGSNSHLLFYLRTSRKGYQPVPVQTHTNLPKTQSLHKALVSILTQMNILIRLSKEVGKKYDLSHVVFKWFATP